MTGFGTFLSAAAALVFTGHAALATTATPPKARPGVADAAGTQVASPAPRPEIPRTRAEAPPEGRPDGLLVRPDPSLSTKAAAPRQVVPEVTDLERALKRMREGDWGSALRIAGAEGSVGRDVIEWHRMRAGRGTFAEVTDFIARRPDWPGMSYLRKQSESAAPLSRAPNDVIAFFAAEAPQTGYGAMALANAQAAMGNEEAAKRLRISAWTEHVLTPSEESALLADHGRMLADHHTARLDFLLWEGEVEAARRMFPRVSPAWRALAEARIGLRRKVPGVNGLIEKVPAALQDDPGLAYERFAWRMDKGLRESARDLMLSRKGNVAGLGRPGAWGEERRVMARRAMRAGDAKTAYALASAHGMSAEDGYKAADNDWLAGYIALTYLDNPAAALSHFEDFRAKVFTPISLGRAFYWAGRAHEAMGDADAAQAAYTKGGAYQTSFYGLLAAEKAGMEMDPALTGRSPRDNWRLASFRESAVFQAAVMLNEAGESYLTERFLTHLAEGLGAEEAAQLGDFAIEMGEPHFAVMIGKRAAQGGVVIPNAYYALMDLGLDRMPVPEELALAIARRESEFDPVVKSHAGARGLMQLMPGTARDVSRELKIAYSLPRLTSDPVYNARLGTTYLKGLIDRFGHNYVFVSAGYNAGPGRPIRWVRERGDPRGSAEEMIDWIEHIPFRETRNYVQRVMESLPIYRARLSGETEPLRLSQEIIAR